MNADESLIVLISGLTIFGGYQLAYLWRHRIISGWLFVVGGLVVVNGLTFLGAVWWSNAVGGMEFGTNQTLSYWSGIWFLHMCATLVGIMANAQLGGNRHDRRCDSCPKE